MERENNSFIHQPGLGFYSRMNTLYERRPDLGQEPRVYDDLYKLVYSLASNYKDMWDNVDANSKSEFADKVTRMLLKKSRMEVRNMIKLSNVLMENVSNAVRKSGEPSTKTLTKNNKD